MTTRNHLVSRSRLFAALSTASLALVLGACGATPAQQAQVPPTAVQVVVTAPPIVITATPEAVWKDKLSGIWNDTSKTTPTEWTIDLDGGRMGFAMGGMPQSDNTTVEIAFDHEEGKRVFVTFIRPNGNGVDSFRFLDDNTLIWEHGDDETTLTRK